AVVIATIAVVQSQSATGPGSASAPLPAGALAFRPIDGAELLVREERDATPTVGQDGVAALAGANTDFALDVYRELAAASDANVIVGPHSISSALAMIYVGARGETATEMADVLHFDSVEGDFGPAFNALDQTLQSRSVEGAVDLRIAIQGFGAPGLDFVDAYLATLGRDFGAPMAELDFADAEAARRVINGWAADRTNDRIEELFPAGEITPQTVLVVANAVSLDADWRYKFSPSQTTNQPFFLPDGSSVQVPTMRFDLYLPLVWTEEYAAVELLYGQGDLSMVLLTAQDFASFEAELDRERLQGIFDSITEQGIHLSMPKFSFKSHTALNDTLQDLGMTSVFGSSADLSGMVSSPGLFLDNVQHEAFIEVDEAGTEAHAATGGALAASHGPTITFDHPFMFVIRDRATGAILFIGRVTDPRG
ncbi:MAG TPA: serpin family protein, partial [Candidatus Limnocylindrales bacterium]|nr:serpin family protein [Candidatus Limnocylindrales bacterium]